MDLEEEAAARGNPRWVWAPPPPRKLAPKPGGAAALGVAPPPLLVTREGLGGAHSPLVGWFAPSPWPIRPPNACRGLRNPFRTRWSSPGTHGTIPNCNTLRPIYRSSPPDHSGAPRHVRDLIRDSEQPLVTTYYFPITLASSNLKCVDPTDSGVMQTWPRQLSGQ